MVDLLRALADSIERAREGRRDEVVICEAHACTVPAQPEHTPCCSSTLHGKALCCKHYCNGHFVEVNQCSPDSHTAAAAVSVTTKDS